METTFKNAGEPWTEKEENQLNKLYNEDKLDIMKISEIHGRAPGGILSRLKKNKYITHREEARGYDIYKKSNFYKEAVQTNKDKYKNDLTEKFKQQQENENILISINKSNIMELQSYVKEMRNEIKELKKGIKELVEMMKVVYEYSTKI